MKAIERVPASKFEALIASGKSVADIANEYGCNARSVRYFMRLRDVQAPGSRKSKGELDERDARIAEMFQSGATIRAIGRAVGLSPARVHGVLKSRGLTSEAGGVSVRGRSKPAPAARPASQNRPPAARKPDQSRQKPARALPTGVYPNPKYGTFIARRSVDGIIYHIGIFASVEDARAAYDRFDHTKHPKFQESKQIW